MALITTGFGHDSTAAEVVEGLDLGGRRAIVTGGASGIGVETARALAGAGAEVTLAVRDTAAGEAAARDIAATTGSDAVRVGRLDLADQDSVAAFAGSWEGSLHILVNNAGVMALPELLLTADGWEMQFATNHLGHFALALGLHDALAAADGARVVSVSSSGHRVAPVVFEDIHFADRPYDPWIAYGQSKTANVLFAVEAARRWGADGITANALMPGGIWTNLQRHVSDEQRAEWDRAESAGELTTLKTPEEGAATSVLLAASPAVAGVSGRYFEDCAEAPVLTETPEGFGAIGVRDYALDPGAAARLWDVSQEMLARRAAARAA